MPRFAPNRFAPDHPACHTADHRPETKTPLARRLLPLGALAAGFGLFNPLVMAQTSPRSRSGSRA